jgi:hypothetical protein
VSLIDNTGTEAHIRAENKPKGGDIFLVAARGVFHPKALVACAYRVLSR